MATLVQKISSTIPASVMGSISVSDSEVILWNSLLTTEWWRAGAMHVSGANATYKWMGMRRLADLTPSAASAPFAPTTTGGFANDKPYIPCDTDNRAVGEQTGKGYVKTDGSSFSLGLIYANDVAATNNNMLGGFATSSTRLQIVRQADNHIRVRHSIVDTGINAALSTNAFASTGPLAVLYSFDGPAADGVLYINGAVESTNTAVGNLPGTDQLWIGGIGKWFDLIVFSGAVHLPVNAVLPTSFWAYAQARYGI